MDIKKFNPLSVSSKFAICGLPLRLDTYKTCSFGCKYCFSNYRKIMEFKKELQVANLALVEKMLNRVLTNKQVSKGNFTETLISDGITWHCGGMSDAFQPIEDSLHVTKQLIDITNKHDVHILFSTKSDNLYNCNLKNNLHTFQFSITNLDNREDIEPNIAHIEKRIQLYKDLKKDGFKVGIRVQPYIPGVTTSEIVDVFHDADYFTIEGLKLVPQNKEQKEYLLDLLSLNKEDFTQMGLLNLKPQIRISLYEKFIEKLNKYNIPYSIADNDLHYISSGKCCCGDSLIHKSTDFNNTALIKKYGQDYQLKNVIDETKGCGECKANYLFTSNRQEGCVSVNDFLTRDLIENLPLFHQSFHINQLVNLKVGD